MCVCMHGKLLYYECLSRLLTCTIDLLVKIIAKYFCHNQMLITLDILYII